MSNFNRREFMGQMAAGAMALTLTDAVPGMATPSTGGKRPNILYVMSDQHRASSLGCYGDPTVRTPHFDAFALQGARFATATSCTPVCCPHRASLMTGQFSHHHGVLSNSMHLHPSAPCLGETFRRAGYDTGYFGKWHIFCQSLGDLQLGFPVREFKKQDEDEEGAAVRGGKSKGHYITVTQKDAKGHNVEKEVYKPTFLVDEAIRFLREHRGRTAPWMLVVSWVPPHTPYASPPQFRAHYQGRLKIPSNVPAGAAEEFTRSVLPDYYGMIESLDTEFGRLLAALDETGAADDTIVCYSADHGDMLGSHACKFKRWPYDASVRVPFLIRYPRAIASGQVVSVPFNTPDIYPTLAGLAGVKAPSKLDGLDYAPLLTGRNSHAPRDHSYLSMSYGYVQWPGWRAVRTEQYAFACTKKGPWFLYDMQKDPLEAANLVAERSSKALVEEMSRQLAAAMEQSGDHWGVKTNGGDIQKFASADTKKLREQNLGVQLPDGGQLPAASPETKNHRRKKHDRRSADAST